MSEALFTKLDPTELGTILLRLTPVAVQFGHKHVKSTMVDYVHATTLEAEFVRDLLTKSTEEIADKWYGGPEEAVALNFK